MVCEKDNEVDCVSCVDGVVGGMTVIVMLAYTMRQDCGGIVATNCLTRCDTFSR